MVRKRGERGGEGRVIHIVRGKDVDSVGDGTDSTCTSHTVRHKVLENHVSAELAST